MNSEEKIKVFISSNCGGEHLNIYRPALEEENDKIHLSKLSLKTSYDIVRRGLIRYLESTGIVETYTFEDAPATSLSAEQSYLSKLAECDVCIFLIDNFVNEPPLGVLKEIDYANNNNKKSIYIFLNDPNEGKTTIQKSLTGSNFPKNMEIIDIREFIDEGYKSVISEIINTYKLYCKGFLKFKEGMVPSANLLKEDILQNTSVPFVEIKKENFEEVGSQTAPIDKEDFRIKQDTINKALFKNLGLTRNKISKIFYDSSKVNDSSNIDKVCLSILQVLLGEKNFHDIDYPFLLETLKEVQNPDIYNLVLNRWTAISNYFNGNIDKSIEILESTYESNFDRDSIPEWLLANIYIDCRNFLILKDYSTNGIVSSTKIQERINKQESIFYFPLVDRFDNEIDDAIFENNFRLMTSTPFTTSFSSLEIIIDNIANYLLTAIYYGSFTHIFQTLKEIQKLLFDVIQKENNLSQKIQLIRMTILRRDESDFEKIMYKFKSSLSHCTYEEILGLYRLADVMPITFFKSSWKVLIFKELGYYFSEKDYEKISKEILNILNEIRIYGDPNFFLGIKLINAIKANKERLPGNIIVQFAVDLIALKYYRHLHGIFELLSVIDYSEVDFDLVQDLITKVENIITNEKNNHLEDHYIQWLFLRIRKSRKDFNEKADEIIQKNFPTFYSNEYNLEIFPKDRPVHIQRYIDILKKRNEVQGKNGQWIGFGDRPYIIIKNILEIDKLILPAEILKELLQTIIDTLLADKQTLSEKSDSIRLLVFLKRQEEYKLFNWYDYYGIIQHNIDKIESGFSQSIFGTENTLLIKLQLTLLRIIFGEKCPESLLEILALFSNSSNGEIINSLIILEEFIRIGKEKLRKDPLSAILNQYITSFCLYKDQDVRFYTVNCLYQLINMKFTNFIINRLTIMMNDDDSDVKWGIVSKISLFKKKDLSAYKYVLGKAAIDNHYLVRKTALDVIANK